MKAAHLALFSFVLLFIVLRNTCRISALIRLNSLHCAVDKDLGNFKSCKITPLSRKRYNISVELELKQTVNSASVNCQIMKKASGGRWHPFLYNVTVDVCDFYQHRTRYPLPNLAYFYGRKYTNANHTCPYKRGENLVFYFDEPIDEKEALLLEKLPVDVGEYGAFAKVYMNGRVCASVNVTGSYSDYRKL